MPLGDLDQLKYNAAEVRPKRRMRAVALALIILALSTIGGGTALLLVKNGFGLVLVLVGLLLTLPIIGSVGVEFGGRRSGRAMWRAETERRERERKRRSGEED